LKNAKQIDLITNYDTLKPHKQVCYQQWTETRGEIVQATSDRNMFATPSGEQWRYSSWWRPPMAVETSM